MNAKNINVTKAQEFEDLSKKVANIESLTDDVAKNSSKVDSIRNYFPQSFKEEDALNMVNYLANSSGVLLSEVTLEKEAALPGMAVATDASGTSVSKQGESNASLAVKFFNVKITVAGEYEKIQMFVDNLQRAKSYAMIANYEINKNESVSTEDTAQSKKNDNILLGKIVLRFGYGAALKDAKYASIDSTSPTVDFSVLSEIDSASSQSVPALSNADAGKRSNPFLP